MKWKKVVSGVLAFAMVMTSVVSTAPMSVSAGDDDETDAANNKTIAVSEIHYTAPAEGEQPQSITAVIGGEDKDHEPLADRSDNPATMVAVDNDGVITYVQEDGVWGFNAQYKNDSQTNDGKFNVYGDAQLLVSFRLFLEKLPSNDDVVSIISKGDQYGVELTRSGLQIVMQNEQGQTITTPLGITGTGKWYDVVAVIDARNASASRLYVDDQVSVLQDHRNINSTSDPFALGCKVSGETVSNKFTTDYGYLADVKFYNSRQLSTDDNTTFRLNLNLKKLDILPDDGLSEIRNLIDTVAPTANFSLKPYDIKTVWETVDGDELDGTFQCGTAYQSVTTFTAHDGYDFTGMDSTQITLKNNNPYQKIEFTSNAQVSDGVADSQETSSEASGTQGWGWMALDGDPSTYWHTQYGGGNNVNVANNQNNTYTITLPKTTMVGQFGYLPRNNGGSTSNGAIWKCVLEYKGENDTEWQTLKDNIEWADNIEWKVEEFEPKEAKQVRIRVTQAKGTNYINAAEFSVYEVIDNEPTLNVKVSDDKKTLTVTATYDKDENPCTSNIDRVAFESGVTMEAGQKHTISKSVYAADGRLVSEHPALLADSAKITYSYEAKGESGTGTTDVITVDATTGEITAKEVGSAIVTATATLEGETVSSRNIPVTVVDESSLLKNPLVTLKSPVAGKYPEIATATLQRDDLSFKMVSDVVEGGSTLSPIDDTKPVVETVDGIAGFVARYQASQADQQFNVIGENPMVITLKLYLKQLPSDTREHTILSKGNQYNFVVMKRNNVPVLRLQTSGGNWAAWAYELDNDFLNKWHDIVIVADGKKNANSVAFFVDGEYCDNKIAGGNNIPEITETEAGVDHLRQFAICDKTEEADMQFTSDDGYLAGIRFYNINLVDPDLADKINVNEIGTDDAAAVIQSLLDTQTPTAHITATPYTMKTTWYVMDGSNEIELDGITPFTSKDILEHGYRARIRFQTYGGFAFGIEDLETVKDWVTLDPELNDDLYNCRAALTEDGRTLEIMVDFLPNQIPVQHFTYASPAMDRTARRQPRYDQAVVEKYMDVADTVWLKNGKDPIAADFEFEVITDTNWYQAKSVLTAKNGYLFADTPEYKEAVVKEIQPQVFGNVEADITVDVSEDGKTMTLYLDYKKAIYLVTFDLDGGSGTGLEPQSVSEGRTAVEPENKPTKDGAAFSYWYTTDDETKYDFKTPVTGNLILHAKWAPVRTVTFHPQLGGIDDIIQIVGDGGEATEEKLPTSANIDFAGWFEKDENGKWKTEKFDFSTPITANLDLYAKWTATVYFFLSEDLDEEIHKQVVVEPGATLEESDLAEPEKTGYTFKGWYTLDGDDTETFDKDTVVNEHTYVFAEWEAESYKVEYDLGDGDWPTEYADKIPSSINYGERLILPCDPDPKADSGNNFGGWYTDQACTKRYDFAPATADIKIYADWTTDDVFTVTYDANADDATITPASVKIVTGHSVMVEPQAEREHYEVEGWYTDKDYSEANKFTFGENGTTVEANVTLYANWKKKTYSVLFNGNGGTLKDSEDDSSISIIKVEAGKSISEKDVPEFEKDGLELEGWYKDARLTQKFTFGTDTIDKDNTRLYAKWVVPVDSITISDESVELIVGETQQLTATVLPATADQTVTWKSSDEDVATVSANGLVTAVGEGEATITASAGKKSATATVKVSEDPDATRPDKLNPVHDFGIKSWSTDQGTSYTSRKILVVRNQKSADATFGVVGEGMLVPGQEANDSSMSLLQFELPKMTNTDKEALKAATLQLYQAGSKSAVTDDTLVAAVVPAESGLTNLDGVDTWSKVSAAVAAWLAADPTNRFEKAGVSGAYTESGGSDMGKATPVATDGHVSIDITEAVKKYSGGTMILAINDTTGIENYFVRTAGAIGNDKFTGATDDMAPTILYSYEGDEVTGITVDPKEYTLSGAGSTVQLTATVTPDTAKDKSVTWTSSDEMIATVDADGKVTAVFNGTATITATANGAAAGQEVKATATIKVEGSTRQEFDVTFHANTDGHDDEVTGMPAKTTCYDQDQLARPTASPSWAGHTFKGWSTTASGTTAVTWPQTITADTDFYAIWQESGSVTPPPSSGDDDDELENAKKALEEAILAAKDIYEGMNIYTEGTWDAFKAAYEAATGDIDNLDADALKELADSLNQAVEDLVVDEEGLTTAITTELADAQGVIGAGNTQYTSASWGDYVDAYNALKEAAESGASIEELVRLYYELIDARLKLTIDTTWVNAKAALNAALSQASAIYAAGGSKYDAASWTAFENAYKAAYAQKDATIANITLDKLNSLASALNTARLGLKLADGSTGGNTTVVSTLKKGDYVDQGGVRYVVTNETTKTVSAQGIASQKKKLKKVTIAATVSINNVTCTVTEIKANAFSKFTKLKKVVIGKNVTKIGNKAFNGCKVMTSLTLNGDVKTFGKQSFYGCKKLKKIAFKGKKVPTFKKKVFKGTPASLKVTLSKTLKKAKTKKTMTTKLRKAGVSKKAKIK